MICFFLQKIWFVRLAFMSQPWLHRTQNKSTKFEYENRPALFRCLSKPSLLRIWILLSAHSLSISYSHSHSMRVRWLATTHRTTCISWFNFDIRFWTHSIAINTLLSIEPSIDFDFVCSYIGRWIRTNFRFSMTPTPHRMDLSCFVWLVPYFKFRTKWKQFASQIWNAHQHWKRTANPILVRLENEGLSMRSSLLNFCLRQI